MSQKDARWGIDRHTLGEGFHVELRGNEKVLGYISNFLGDNPKVIRNRHLQTACLQDT